MFSVVGSMSMKIGVALRYSMGFVVATQDSGVVMIWSPGLVSRAASAMCSAAVPVFVATPCFAPQYSANECSSCSTFLPWVTQPVFIVSIAAWISFCVMSGLAMGILTFRPQVSYPQTDI